MLLFILKYLISMLCILVGVAFITLLERKVLSYNQTRVGVQKVSLMGLLQPVLDGVKLFLKQTTNLKNNIKVMYMLSIFLLMILFLMVYFSLLMNNFKFYYLYFIMILSLFTIPMFFIGWSSNSKFSFLGSIRSLSQMISFEISFNFLIFNFIMFYKSLNIFKEYNLFSTFLMFIVSVMLVLSLLVEMNRIPFDFAEGESELVSGFNTEYSSVLFAIIFISEYGIMITYSIFVCMLMGFFKEVMFFALILVFLMFRSVFPRFRYDKLMYLNWFKLLPMGMIFFILIFSLQF